MTREIYQKFLDPKNPKQKLHVVYPSRKAIIKRFVDEAGLTANGANTYLYNFDRKHKQTLSVQQTGQ